MHCTGNLRGYFGGFGARGYLCSEAVQSPVALKLEGLQTILKANRKGRLKMEFERAVQELKGHIKDYADEMLTKSKCLLHSRKKVV